MEKQLRDLNLISLIFILSHNISYLTNSINNLMEIIPS